jgi:hypothetical protein
MSIKFKNINEMFNTIESKITGGANDVSPYNIFSSSLNNIYDYFNVIFVNKEENKQKYQASVENLDKSCDCSKYKCKKEHDDIDEEDVEIEDNDIKDDDIKDDDIEDQKKNNESKLLLKNEKLL